MALSPSQLRPSRSLSPSSCGTRSCPPDLADVRGQERARPGSLSVLELPNRPGRPRQGSATLGVADGTPTRERHLTVSHVFRVPIPISGELWAARLPATAHRDVGEGRERGRPRRHSSGRAKIQWTTKVARARPRAELRPLLFGLGLVLGKRALELVERGCLVLAWLWIDVVLGVDETISGLLPSRGICASTTSDCRSCALPLRLRLACWKLDQRSGSLSSGRTVTRALPLRMSLRD